MEMRRVVMDAVVSRRIVAAVFVVTFVLLCASAVIECVACPGAQTVNAALAWIKSTVHVADWASWLAVWHLGDLATRV